MLLELSLTTYKFVHGQKYHSMNKGSISFRWIITGLLFTLLWASASTATKFGLEAAQPLVIAVVRFGFASFFMLVAAHGILKYKLPKGKQWAMLAVYGLLNITIYLGLYVLAMQKVTAGIGALAVATNPLFIGFLSVIFLKERLNAFVLVALLLGITGVVVASYPLLHNAGVSLKGLLLMLFSMLSYSSASVYFNKKNWGGLKILTINGWQTLIGGVLLLPFTMAFYHKSSNHFNLKFWGSVLWLAVFVSVCAIQCWLWLLKSNPLKASMWLFLTPIFGFIIAAFFLHDAISLYTVIGVALVIAALFISQMNKGAKQIVQEELTINE